MSRTSTSRQGWLQRSAAWFSGWLLKHGQQPYAIWSLSALCILDGFLPMVPAEFIALALMILQPRRMLLVAFAFAVSAATSAGLLATLVAGVAKATALTGWLAGEHQSAAWAQAVSLIQRWGAPALAVAAVFPDSPRTSIAVAALAGLAPIDITRFVLLGKLLLYGLLALAVQYIPARWPRRHTATWPGARHLRRAIQRFIALRRWVDRRSVQKGTSGEK
jgi:membrane protein YqaA with SNARE-associated domain